MDRPDFLGLVRFLVEPFLDSPVSLRIDSEENPALAKVWIRVAFSGDERGKVFGRGGRNIQAMRSIVRATAALTGWVAYFDVYGSPDQDTSAKPGPKDFAPQRPSRPKPQLRPKPPSA
ncbi:MAG: KH domain-containing protein [Nodosilinea sp.]